MRDIAFSLIFCCLIALAFRRSWVAVLIWAWLSYMNPHRFCYGFAGYTVPWTMITAVITVISCLMSSERNYFPWTSVTLLEVLFCLWMTFTAFFALEPDLAWPYWQRTLKIQAMIFVTYLLMKNRLRLEALVWVIVVSIGFYGLKGGIWILLTGGGDRVKGPVDSMIEGNNEIALALVMVLPLMRYLQLHSRNPWVRRGLVVSQAITTIAIIGTYSRAGFLALCVVWMFVWLKSQHKLATALAIGLVAVPAIRFMPQEWKDRMSTLKTTDEDSMDGSAKGRLNAWRFGWNLAKARPITGGGFRVYQRREFAIYAPDPIDVHDSHSIYFEVLGEHGFVGLGIFAALGFSTWRTARWVRKKSKSLPELAWARDLVTLTLVGLTGYTIGGAFAGLAYFDLPYHMISIIAISGILVKDAIRSANPGRSGEVPAALPAMQEA